MAARARTRDPARPRAPSSWRCRALDRAIQILSEQISRTMRLLGVNSLEELTPAHVTQLTRLQPVAPSIAAAAETVRTPVTVS